MPAQTPPVRPDAFSLFSLRSTPRARRSVRFALAATAAAAIAGVAPAEPVIAPPLSPEQTPAPRAVPGAFPGLSPEVAARPALDCDLPPQAVARSLWAANLWPGGQVYYQFNANADASMRSAMRLALNELETVANLKFTVRTNQPNFLQIQNSSGNSSFVGMIGGGQTVNIFNWNFQYIMEHEIMHALGVWHEQSRSDRGNYVIVNYPNMQAGTSNNFDIVNGAANVGTYDFESIMHYSGCAFSICCPAGSSCACITSCATIQALPQYAQFQSVMGNRTQLSAGDEAGLVSRYGASVDDQFEDNDTLQTARALDYGSHDLRLLDYEDYFSVTLAAQNTLTITATYTEGDMNLDLRLLDSNGTVLQSTNALNGSDQIVRSVNAGTYIIRVLHTLRWGGNYTLAISQGCPELTLSGFPSPPAPREKPAACFDSVRNQAVIFGGANFSGAYNPPRFDDTWLWNGSTWTKYMGSGPPLRTNAMMAFDAARAKTVLFGGYDGAQELADTWTWDGSSWTQIPAVPPIPRDGGAMTYDPDLQVVLMFGGFTPGGLVNDTWTWNGSSWSGPNPANSPPAREAAAMAYDPVNHNAVLFGGHGNSGFLSDTWLWNGTNWSQAAAPGPSGRYYPRMVFDAALAKIVLQGGYDGTNNLNDIWTWDGSAWTQITSFAAFPGRAGAAMVFDSARSQTVIFGGAGDSPAFLADTWKLNLLSPSLSFSQQPSSASACPGATVLFSVAVTDPNAALRWRRDGVPLGDGAEYSGTATPTLTISPVSQFDYATYDCVASTCFSATSNPVTLSPANVPPSISPQPQATTICRLGNTALTVGASGAGPITYQWKKAAVPVSNSPGHIAGATTATLSFTGTLPSDAGSYSADVTGPCGMTSSNSALLKVCTADFNCSGTVSPQDIFDFLAAWFSHLQSADVNDSLSITPQDIFDFLAFWFNHC